MIIPELPLNPEDPHDGLKYCTKRIIFEDFDLASLEEERVLGWSVFVMDLENPQ